MNMGKRGIKLGENYISQARIQRVFHLIFYLMAAHRTAQEISERFDFCERTTYRYLNLILSLDIGLEEDFYGRYFIADSPCPFCRKEKIHYKHLAKASLKTGSETVFL